MIFLAFGSSVRVGLIGKCGGRWTNESVIRILFGGCKETSFGCEVFGGLVSVLVWDERGRDKGRGVQVQVSVVEGECRGLFLLEGSLGTMLEKNEIDG